MSVERVDGYLLFDCPSCGLLTQVLETDLACCIFRHGILKDTFDQMNPHASVDECNSLVERGIYGCGKPFRIVKMDNRYSVETCEYI